MTWQFALQGLTALHWSNAIDAQNILSQTSPMYWPLPIQEFTLQSLGFSKPLRVLVLHAESIVALGLTATLSDHPGIEVVQGGKTDISPGPFDVVVCDLATAIAKTQPSCSRKNAQVRGESRVMVLSAESSERAVRQALGHGVHGFLLIDSPLVELVNGVMAVGRGQSFLSQVVAQRMAESLTRESLTARESDVLTLLAEGQCNKHIAQELAIAVGTVKAHVKAIMAKLGASSRTQAVTVAARRGLVDFEFASNAGVALRSTNWRSAEILPET